jgi:hypothetical protein
MFQRRRRWQVPGHSDGGLLGSVCVRQLRPTDHRRQSRWGGSGSPTQGKIGRSTWRIRADTHPSDLPSPAASLDRSADARRLRVPPQVPQHLSCLSFAVPAAAAPPLVQSNPTNARQQQQQQQQQERERTKRRERAETKTMRTASSSSSLSGGGAAAPFGICRGHHHRSSSSSSSPGAPRGSRRHAVFATATTTKALAVRLLLAAIVAFSSCAAAAAAAMTDPATGTAFAPKVGGLEVFGVGVRKKGPIKVRASEGSREGGIEGGRQTKQTCGAERAHKYRSRLGCSPPRALSSLA